MPGYVLHALYIRIPLNSYNSTKGQVLLSSLIFQVKNLRHIEVKKHTKVAQVTSGRARFKPRQVCPRAQILSTIMLLLEESFGGRGQRSRNERWDPLTLQKSYMEQSLIWEKWARKLSWAPLLLAQPRQECWQDHENPRALMPTVTAGADLGRPIICIPVALETSQDNCEFLCSSKRDSLIRANWVSFRWISLKTLSKKDVCLELSMEGKMISFFNSTTLVARKIWMMLPGTLKDLCFQRRC